MIQALLLIFSAISATQSASAIQHPIGSRVSHQDLKIRGKGIHNPDTNEAFYLACTSNEDDCEEMQFVLAKPNGQVLWWSQAFKIKSQKEFKKIMRNLVWATKRNPNGGRTLSTILGISLVFATTAVVTVEVGTGAGLLFLALATYIAAHSKGDWEAFDFLTRIPVAAADRITLSTFESTTDQGGWNWSVRTKRMKPKRFLRMKKLLSHPNEFNLQKGTIWMSYGESGFYEYLHEMGDVEWKPHPDDPHYPRD